MTDKNGERRRGKRSLIDKLLALHLKMRPSALRLLQTIGRLPLLTLSELADLLDVSRRQAYRCREEIRELVDVVGEQRELALNGDGIALLAFQSGISLETYARLRRWRLRWEWVDGDWLARHSIDHLMKCYKHHRLVLNFLIGFVRTAKRRPQIRLTGWDREFLYVFPDRKAPVPKPGQKIQGRWVIPDAMGTAHVSWPANGANAARRYETEFWLEIDRGGTQGKRLEEKLSRYYAARGGMGGTMGWLPRLLVVVERNDEGRAQLFARRIAELDRRHGRQLDVVITRLDLLETARGDLDPTLKVWRRPGKWDEMACAFDGLPLPADVIPAETMDLIKLRKETIAQQKRAKARRERKGKRKGAAR